MITVFTPTYNRKELLFRLYESLLGQTSKDFEWLIVDDGSSDGTEETINSFIKENKIPITYIAKSNGGKHTAFNLGVKNANGELFFCVDSDDFLPPNAIEDIINASDKISQNNISGIIAYKNDINGKRLSNELPSDISYSTAYILDKIHGCCGEWSFIYKTEILKNNLYPEIKGEKFIGESVLYDKLGNSFDMYLLNKIVTTCEYQNDGLTSHFFATMLKNPIGYKIYYGQRIDMALSFTERIGYGVRYNAFKLLSRESKHDYKGKHKTLITLLRPLGHLLKHYYNINNTHRS